MKNFKDDEIIVLLGAGSSCDAGIKNSNQIISDIESRLKSEPEWKKFTDLYNYIKSVFFQLSLQKGVAVNDVNFNIENLVSLLDIIISINEKKLDIYPFVGSWQKDLQPFISEEKTKNLASNFREYIIKSLRGDWLMPSSWKEKSSYFKKLIDFKREYDGCALKIFTLNYDKCVEQNLKTEKFESGFDEYDVWNSKRYDHEITGSDYYLYKLHGSIDWEKRKEKQLMQKIGDINPNDLAIVFGISNKLQSYDPYLFYFYEFRIHCIKSQLVICSGYGFLDGHINDVIKHGFADNTTKQLVVNIYEPKKDDEQLKNDISLKLNIAKEQITLVNKKANEFFNEDLKLSELSKLFPEDEEDLPEGI
jgi:hypothetical protein